MACVVSVGVIKEAPEGIVFVGEEISGLIFRDVVTAHVPTDGAAFLFGERQSAGIFEKFYGAVAMAFIMECCVRAFFPVAVFVSVVFANLAYIVEKSRDDHAFFGEIFGGGL